METRVGKANAVRRELHAHESWVMTESDISSTSGVHCATLRDKVRSCEIHIP